MTELNFNDEEINYIKETFNIVLDDIREIYNVTDQEHLFIRVELTEDDKYLLCIGKKTIALLTLKIEEARWQELWKKEEVNFSYNGNCLLETEKLVEGKWLSNQQEKVIWRNPLLKSNEINCIARFLSSYEQIRESIINNIQSMHDEKEDIMQKLSHIRCKYGSEVLVDFGTNNSMNMQHLSVAEEDGKKIGTIDFGSRIVKIITEGDIVLTKVEPIKNKVKNK